MNIFQILRIDATNDVVVRSKLYADEDEAYEECFRLNSATEDAEDEECRFYYEVECRFVPEDDYGLMY